MALPRMMALKSNHNANYLSYRYEDGETRKLFQFSATEVITPFTKFELHSAKDGDGFFHVRSCYNNKYFVRRSSEERWISADADEPEEDRSTWRCTLFEPIFIAADDDKTIIRLRHVQLDSYTCCLSTAPTPYNDCLYAGSVTSDPLNLFTVIDWESLVLLPKHIAFKGDNGCYLSAQWTEGYQYLQFSSYNLQDSSVWNEVFITSDGKTRIKSDYYGKFWRRSPNWIWGDSTDTTSNNPDTLFSPVRVDCYNMIALRNLGNNYFCKRLTTEGKTSCLNAAVPTFSYEAHLEFEELVVSREIYGIHFKVEDARIYDRHVLTLACGEAINITDEDDTMTVNLPYEDTQMGTWDSTTTIKMVTKTNLETVIPIIENGKIELGEEFLGSYDWGQPRTSSNSKVEQQIVTVPPNKQVVVSLLATKASYDIPFSYIQYDTLINGEHETYYMDDGIYSGVNYYNFEFNKEEEPLR